MTTEFERRIQNLTEQVTENKKDINKITSILLNLEEVANNNFKIIKEISNILVEEIGKTKHERTNTKSNSETTR